MIELSHGVKWYHMISNYNYNPNSSINFSSNYSYSYSYNYSYNPNINYNLNLSINCRWVIAKKKPPPELDPQKAAMPNT